MIKIFFLNKTIYLINNKDIFKPKKDAESADINSADELLLKYNKLINKADLKEIFFFNKSLSKLLDYFTSRFHLIEAAGGIVKNKNAEYLFIFRNGKWDLPKGKIEKGESIEKAAIRETEEECGISGLTITGELPPTYHIYFIGEKAILKRTYWFKMLCEDCSELVPQLEEGITEAQWIAKKNLKKVFNNTFESVKEVIKTLPE